MAEISATNPYPYEAIAVRDARMAYFHTPGDGAPIVLLHGNPTSSYLWRNVVPHLERHGPCFALDLIGFGRSAPMPSGTYRFHEHIAYLDAWFDAIVPDGPIRLVLHDWGAALGFDWARRHPDRVSAMCYGEAMVQPRRWSDLPGPYQNRFMAMRTPEGFAAAVDENLFIDVVFANGIIRKLRNDEVAVYSERFSSPEAIVPTIQWPCEIPFDGLPADNHTIVQTYADWLVASPVPKLFVNTTDGHALIGRNRDFCRTWPNQTEITVTGKHYYPEDSPHELGEAIAGWLDTVAS